MPLNLYRRHLRIAGKCVGSHEPDSRNYEPEELRRGWRKCHCPIYICGTLNGHFKRQNSHQTKWEDAKLVATALESADSWDGKNAVIIPPPVVAPVAEVGRITISDACAVFMSLREGERIAHATLRKHRTFMKQLQAFAESRGYVMLDQFTRADIDVFYGGMTHGLRTKAKRLSALRAFFRFCVNREWLVKSPVSSDLKPPQGSSKVTNKAPFTDEELDRIIKACDSLGEIHWLSHIGSGVWSGEDAMDFIWTLTYTGLRISDVVSFNIKRLHGNEVFLRAKKNGGDVFAYIPDWLRDRLVARSKVWGPMLFRVGQSERVDTMTDTRDRKLNKAFELAVELDESLRSSSSYVAADSVQGSAGCGCSRSTR